MSNYKNKDSIKDFGKQFKYHDKIDDYWGSHEILKDMVNPFDLNLIKNKKNIQQINIELDEKVSSGE